MKMNEIRKESSGLEFDIGQESVFDTKRFDSAVKNQYLDDLLGFSGIEVVDNNDYETRQWIHTLANHYDREKDKNPEDKFLLELAKYARVKSEEVIIDHGSDINKKPAENGSRILFPEGDLMVGREMNPVNVKFDDRKTLNYDGDIFEEF